MTQELLNDQKNWEEHIEEWTKLGELYKNQAKSNTISDPMYFRYRCIQGLIDKTTYCN